MTIKRIFDTQAVEALRTMNGMPIRKPGRLSKGQEMDWGGLFAILGMTTLTAIVGFTNLRYMRTGIIFGVLFSVARSRTPRLFQIGIVLGWFGFAWMLFLTLAISVGMMLFWLGAIT